MESKVLVEILNPKELRQLKNEFKRKRISLIPRDTATAILIRERDDIEFNKMKEFIKTKMR